MTAIEFRAGDDARTAWRVDARPQTVLIVDDDRAVRESLHFLLAGEGVVVSVAADVDEAAQRLAEQQFEVVITDLSMLGGGRRWVEYVHSIQPDAAVIIITALDVGSGPVDALRDTGCVVLSKPVPADYLFEALTHAMRGSQDQV